MFAEIAEQLRAFLGDDARLVIHNAGFDMGFLNAELDKLGFEPLGMDRAIDTVKLARRRFPGAQVNLDALCRRFGIDNSDRTYHGALKDALLLAQVYLELIGGREPGLALDQSRTKTRSDGPAVEVVIRPPRPHPVFEDEAADHAAFVAKLKDPIWNG